MKNEKLIDKCEMLSNVIQNVAKLYHQQETNDNKKQLLETMIGAAIWYLPQSKKLWTGRISLRVIESFHPQNDGQPKLTKDHIYPRKLSAIELLNTNWSEHEQPALYLLEQYIKRYGIFNYIHPAENRNLMKYQKKHVFTSVEDAYNSAGIILINVSNSELKKIESRNREVIEALMNMGKFISN